MFGNIGKTLCVIGKIIFWLIISGGIVSAIFNLVEESSVFLALIFLVCGFISASVIALPIYGFGRLIQDVETIKEELTNNK